MALQVIISSQSDSSKVNLKYLSQIWARDGSASSHTQSVVCEEQSLSYLDNWNDKFILPQNLPLPISCSIISISIIITEWDYSARPIRREVFSVRRLFGATFSVKMRVCEVIKKNFR